MKNFIVSTSKKKKGTDLWEGGGTPSHFKHHKEDSDNLWQTGEQWPIAIKEINLERSQVRGQQKKVKGA